MFHGFGVQRMNMYLQDELLTSLKWSYSTPLSGLKEIGFPGVK